MNAKGAFIGLTHSTSKGDMSKAIMEGVAFALRDCLEIAKENGCRFKKATICGGGSKSDVWDQIVSDILNIPIYKNNGGGSFGAALLAYHGVNNIAMENSVLLKNLKYEKAFLPDPNKVPFYNKKYNYFRKLYPAIKSCFER